MPDMRLCYDYYLRTSGFGASLYIQIAQVAFMNCESLKIRQMKYYVYTLL